MSENRLPLAQVTRRWLLMAPSSLPGFHGPARAPRDGMSDRSYDLPASSPSRLRPVMRLVVSNMTRKRAAGGDNARKKYAWPKVCVCSRQPAPDPDHSLDEDRFVTFGISTTPPVDHRSTDRDDTIRIISARPATPSERKIYEEG